MRDKHSVRPPAVAGLFYDDSPDVLRKNIDEYLENVKVPKVKGTVRALVSPHAGYVYSGFTAAHAYKMVAGNKYDCVIVVGPSHREYFNGVSIYPGDAYETPLGSIPINNEIATAINPTAKEIRAPIIKRLNISRPKRSVPKINLFFSTV